MVCFFAVVTVVVVILCVLQKIFSSFCCQKEKEESEQRRPSAHRRHQTYAWTNHQHHTISYRNTTSYSNPYNNHDRDKYLHATREDAELEVARMKRCDYYEGSERLNAYCNKELGAWFVGRSSNRW